MARKGPASTPLVIIIVPERFCSAPNRIQLQWLIQPLWLATLVADSAFAGGLSSKHQVSKSNRFCLKPACELVIWFGMSSFWVISITSMEIILQTLSFEAVASVRPLVIIIFVFCYTALASYHRWEWSDDTQWHATVDIKQFWAPHINKV